MRRFFRAERLLDLLVIVLAVPTVISTASLAPDAPAATPTPLRQVTADGACTTASASACFANPERRERANARARVSDVQRAWHAAERRLAPLGAALQARERRWKLALERCDAGATGCTTALKTE